MKKKDIIEKLEAALERARKLLWGCTLRIDTGNKYDKEYKEICLNFIQQSHKGWWNNK